MKLFKMICVLSGLGLPSFVSAASSSRTLQAHVPFSFVLAGQEFAPGDYRVQQNQDGLIFVQGNGKAAVALSSPCSLEKPGASSSLQFTSDRQREYLVGVHIEGEPNRAIPVRFEENRKLTFTAAH